MKTKANVMIRWLLRQDMPDILDIERSSFEIPWTEEDFLCALRQRDAIGMVVEVGVEVVGYMIYELHKNQLRLTSMAVHQAYRRQGIGAAMIDRLKGKLTQQRRKRLTLEVIETNLEALKFFRSQGFVAYSVLRDYYADSDRDAFAMRYSVNAADEVLPPVSPVWRMI